MFFDDKQTNKQTYGRTQTLNPSLRIGAPGKNDNNVGLLRTVKKYGYKKNTANNKIGMGLVMSHTYNLSHAYLSHTPHFKAPYISGLIEGDRVARYR